MNEDRLSKQMSEVPEARRSVVVILCDQLRPDFLNIYGCEAVPTPNMDRLAGMGVVFDRAITVSTVCAPARASMMTGRYVSDHQVWTNDVPFRGGMDYIAERMNELGYATGAFGKLHHCPADDSKGFQRARQMEEGRLGDDEPYFQWLRERHPEIKRIFNHKDYEFAFSREEYYEYWIASEAISFIESQVEEKKPFLAWVSFQGPHGPLDPPREVKGTCRAEALPLPLRRSPAAERHIPPTVRVREVCGRMPDEPQLMKMRLAYAEMIVEIDRQIGRIIGALESLGVLEETTFIFSADHGDMLGDYKLNGKGPFPYRAQLNIPLIAANHPLLQPGARSLSLTGNLDIPGTLLDIAGADRPMGISRSLLDLARRQPGHPRTVNYSEFCDSIKTVEDERYRFSYYPFTNYAELYDLTEDPDETTNLADRPEYSSIRARFLEHITDLLLMAKGVRVEAHDFAPEQQAGLADKDPDYQRDFPVAFPLTQVEVDRLKNAGLPADFNEFCRGKKVLRHYARPYWMEGQSDE